LYPVSLDRLRAAYPNIPVSATPTAFLNTVASHISLPSTSPSALSRTDTLRNCLNLPDRGLFSVLANNAGVDSSIISSQQEGFISRLRDSLADDPPLFMNNTVAIAARGCASALFMLSDVELVNRYERNAELAHAISIPSQGAVASSFCAVWPLAYGAWQDGVQHFSVEQRDRCERAEKLHCMAHMSDDVVCEALAIGEFRWANITYSPGYTPESKVAWCLSALSG
jgi:hypothetical protein